MVETSIRTIAGKTEGSGCLPDWSHFSHVDGYFCGHVHFLKYTATVVWIWTFGKNIKSLKKNTHLELFFFFFFGYLYCDCNVTFSGCSHDTHCWPLTPLSSFPGRPIPPTSSSSLLPSAQLPSSHNPPPVSCQMPLLDSNTSHQIMDTNPDEEFSPNSYLLRACSGPQQASSSGKETVASEHVVVVCAMIWSPLWNDTSKPGLGRRWCGERGGEVRLSSGDIEVSGSICWRLWLLKRCGLSEQSLALLQWEEFPPNCTWESAGLKGEVQRDDGILNVVLLWFWS